MNSSQVTETVDRLVNHLSVNNVNPPRFDAFKDVHDFLIQFEKTTGALEDGQKLLVLPKAFPVDCYRSWYETELNPLIKSKAKWSDVKKAIILRFSNTDDQDKHFAKLRELRYDPDEGKSILSHIEDIIYSYQRAHPNDSVCNTIKYVKASVPPSVKAKLNLYHDFKTASSFEMLKSAAKDFDMANITKPTSSLGQDTSDKLIKVFTEMMLDLKKENESTRKAIVSAIQDRESSRSQDGEPHASSTVDRRAFDRQRPQIRSDRDYRARSPSPGYNNNQFKRSFSPERRDNYGGNRNPMSSRNLDRSQGRSPSPTFNRQNYPPKPIIKVTDSKDGGNQVDPSESKQAFDTQEYYRRFGKPPYPCQNCGFNHFMRHCTLHLN